MKTKNCLILFDKNKKREINGINIKKLTKIKLL